jgi:hypothetical protein
MRALCGSSRFSDARQAATALEPGADVLVAQGGEAGGHSGDVGTMVVVPHIVDMAGDTPVIAAGGIADGRGLAADRLAHVSPRGWTTLLPALPWLDGYATSGKSRARRFEIGQSPSFKDSCPAQTAGQRLDR